MSYTRRGIAVPPTTTEQEAMELVHNLLTTWAKQRQSGLKPDEDWMPIWLILTPGHGTLITGNLTPRAMTKRAADFARRVGATAIGHLHTSWTVPLAEMTEERAREAHALALKQDGSTEGIPERYESLLLTIHTASQQRMYIARLTRSTDQPPALGEFEPEPDIGMDGAMIDPLVAALKRIG